PNPYWRGGVKVAFSLPSIGMWWEELPEQSLDGTPLGEWIRLSFPIPAALRNTLNTTTYDDLIVHVLLNVPAQGQTWLVDRISFGTVEEEGGGGGGDDDGTGSDDDGTGSDDDGTGGGARSEEHTSELQ